MFDIEDMKRILKEENIDPEKFDDEILCEIGRYYFLYGYSLDKSIVLAQGENV
jgi:hypothetical protein